MILILVGFLSVVVGLALTPSVVTFANNTANALTESGNTDFASYAPFVGIVVLVWIAAVIGSAAGLVYAGFKSRNAN